MRRPARQAREGHGPHTLKVWRGTIVGFGGGDDVFVELGPRMQGVISRGAFETEPVIGDVHEFTLRGQEESLWVLSLREARSLSTWENMEAGSVVQARAIRVNRGGLELKIGPLHAFMPKSQTGLDREQPLEILVGKTMVCEVSEVDRERQRVLLSRKAVLRRERESERKRELGSLAPGQVVQGRVSRIESYGVFVRFGRGLEGLIHVSDLSHERVQNPADLVKRGSLFITRPTLFDYTAERRDLDAMARETFAALKKKWVRAQIHQRYKLADAAQAHRDLEARKTTGASVILPA